MDKNHPFWHKGVLDTKIEDKQIHLWRVSLELSGSQTETLFKMLSPDERERAARFHFEKDQKRFISGRGLLRKILALYLKKNAQEIEFAYTSYGKPLIKTDSDKKAFSFNLTHSGGLMLFAITLGREIGIDIEHIRTDIEVLQIAQRFFTPAEIHSLNEVKGNFQIERFYQYWTRKEAFLKAFGKGLSFPLEQVDVSSQSGSAWSVVQIPKKHESPAWYSKDVFLDKSYKAAIVVEGKDCGILFRSIN